MFDGVNLNDLIHTYKSSYVLVSIHGARLHRLESAKFKISVDTDRIWA